jgi:hypothetical protein
MLMERLIIVNGDWGYASGFSDLSESLDVFILRAVVAGERRQPLVLWSKSLVEWMDSPPTSYSTSLDPAAFGIEIDAGVSLNVLDIYLPSIKYMRPEQSNSLYMRYRKCCALDCCLIANLWWTRYVYESFCSFTLLNICLVTEIHGLILAFYCLYFCWWRLWEKVKPSW